MVMLSGVLGFGRWWGWWSRGRFVVGFVVGRRCALILPLESRLVWVPGQDFVGPVDDGVDDEDRHVFALE